MIKSIQIILMSCLVFSGFSQNYEAKLIIDNDANTVDLLMQVVPSGSAVPAGTNISTISMKIIGDSNITGLVNTSYTMQVPNANGLIITSSSSFPSPDTWTPGVFNLVATYNLDPANSPYTVSDLDITDETSAGDPTEVPTMSAFVAGGFDQVVAPEATMLPIVLNTFQAAASKKDADLTWTTSSEINGSHFEIERSANGRDYTYVSSVEAAGESSRELDYNYKDINAASIASPEGAMYYRLRMVDRDGSYEYSETRIVQFEKGTSSFRVFPNPTAQKVTVALQGYEINDQTKLAIFDVTGKMVTSTKVQSQSEVYDLTSMGLTPGVYQMMLMQNGTVLDQLPVAVVE